MFHPIPVVPPATEGILPMIVSRANEPEVQTVLTTDPNVQPPMSTRPSKCNLQNIESKDEQRVSHEA